MSVHAGQIIHVAGNNVIDRVQSAGLGDVRVPTEVIREVGNREVVDKVPGEPDFSFSIETFDVSTEPEAWLTGKVGTGLGSAAAPGATDPDGTEYKWSDCGFLNVASPWKDDKTGSAGVVQAGHLVAGYYPTRIRYRFGVSDNASQEIELSGGAFYYAGFPPVEEFFTGTGAQTAFDSSEDAVPHRIGGESGTTFRHVFGVIVDRVLQTEGTDYTVAIVGGNARVTFTVAPPSGKSVRFTYFANAARSFPQPVHASTLVKPGAVRGRNICVKINTSKLPGTQSAELEATVEGEVEREFCNDEIVGRTINGRDCTGTVTVRARDIARMLDLLAQITGVAPGEVFGWLNQHEVDLAIEIQNPKNPSQLLKTLVVDDAIFQVPGTPARVNAPTDFEMRWESKSGDFSVFKGARP